MRKACCHRWAQLWCNYFNLSFNDRCVRILAIRQMMRMFVCVECIHFIFHAQNEICAVNTDSNEDTELQTTDSNTIICKCVICISEDGRIWEKIWLAKYQMFNAHAQWPYKHISRYARTSHWLMTSRFNDTACHFCGIYWSIIRLK